MRVSSSAIQRLAVGAHRPQASVAQRRHSHGQQWRSALPAPARSLGSGRRSRTGRRSAVGPRASASLITMVPVDSTQAPLESSPASSHRAGTPCCPSRGTLAAGRRACQIHDADRGAYLRLLGRGQCHSFSISLHRHVADPLPPGLPLARDGAHGRRDDVVFLPSNQHFIMDQ